jgi:hypothetical protein
MVTAWSADGDVLAYASDTALAATHVPASPGEPLADLFRFPLTDVRGLGWSPDNQRLAVVTSETVRVADRVGTQFCEAPGYYSGNPRWSPDGQRLTVSARGAYDTYLFDHDVSLLWLALDATTCDGDPWSSVSGTFTFDAFTITDSVDIPHGWYHRSPVEPFTTWISRWDQASSSYKISLYDLHDGSPRPFLRYQGGHIVHTGLDIGREYITWTDNGTGIIFTTVWIGHGGCLS